MFASLGGCTLPVLSVLAAKLNDKSFNRWRFVLEFFAAQFLLFSLLNLAVATVYTLFEFLQPILLLLAAIITFALAVSLYLGKPLPVPVSGGIYGIALSPCSIGFAVAASTTSTDYVTAILNAFFFSLGVTTPIAAILFVLESAEPIQRRAHLIEKLSVALLFIVSFYLAYLAGASWRWLP
ncbi:MAG: hypothetical protein GXO00_01830 [Candidatus Diapherotrites archaeon]|nr:hypothetical protein [Candidatus Diapherotrites archaeon]